MKILTALFTTTLLAGSTVLLPAQAQSPSSQSSTLDRAAMLLVNAASIDSPDLIATGGSTALVFDPPSNVRDRPNGNIVCTITTRRQINVYRYADDANQWLYTDACAGRDGVIHISQIRR